MRSHPALIAASLLSADCACLGEEVKQVTAAGADWIHLDVMDQHFVPNLTFGPVVCQALRRVAPTAYLDVHLMVQPVDALIDAFAQAGASALTIHPEASIHLHRSLQQIKQRGCRVGLALNPATPLSCLEPVLPLLDQILVMSVNPGWGGQSFIESSIERIQHIRRMITASEQSIHLAVDGGLNDINIARVVEAGADVLVMGTALFSQPDYVHTIAHFKQLLEQ